MVLGEVVEYQPCVENAGWEIWSPASGTLAELCTFHPSRKTVCAATGGPKRTVAAKQANVTGISEAAASNQEPEAHRWYLRKSDRIYMCNTPALKRFNTRR